jgi:hypothetical protein
MNSCRCGHAKAFHHAGKDDCHWKQCGCSIYEDVDDDDVKDVYSPVTPTVSDAYTYNTNPRLAALRHVEAGNELRQNQPESQPEGPTWPWAW